MGRGAQHAEPLVAGMVRLLQSHGTHYVTDRDRGNHVYDRVRNFLVRRHKMPSRGIGPFSRNGAVFGELGVPRLRATCEHTGAMS
jgi:RNA-directed DNA polymerase